jgi:hypothetical protein
VTNHNLVIGVIIFIVLLVLIKLGGSDGGGKSGKGRRKRAADFVDCPYCGRAIRYTASICHHCHRRIKS